MNLHAQLCVYIKVYIDDLSRPTADLLNTEPVQNKFDEGLDKLRMPLSISLNVQLSSSVFPISNVLRGR